MKFYKKILILIFILFLLAFAAAFFVFLTPNTSNEYNLFIDEAATFESISSDLKDQSIIKSITTFFYSCQIA